MEELSAHLVSLEEALERWALELEFRGCLKETPSEVVSVSESLGRITSEPVFAVHSSPASYVSSVDGIALPSARTFGVSKHNPLRLHLGEEAFFVAVGSEMPEEFHLKDPDEKKQITPAVIPIDKVKFLSIEEVEIRRFCPPWDNVRAIGEEVAAKELIIPAHHKIRPLDVAALYMGGVSEVRVLMKPRVGVLPISSSIVVDVKGENKRIIESSSHIISSSVEEMGGEALIMDTVPERVEKVLEAMVKGAKYTDLLVIIAGPSKKTRLIAELLYRVGELVTYGVMVKPGMSSCFGFLENTPVIGLPGYAVSTYIIFETFCKPLIYRKMSITKFPRKKKIRAYISKDVNSPQGVDEFIRVSLAKVANIPIAAPISRGAHVLMSLVRADGLVRIERDKEKLAAGDPVEVELLKHDVEMDKRVLICGTHDLCFDILRNELQRRYEDVGMFVSNMGSLKGMMVLRAGYCHISSVHLFDDETGEFNIPFIKKFLYDIPLIVVNVFFRKLGFIVQKGNPKKIKGFEDLTRPDIKIINRVRGSGTRQIFDYYLKKYNIDKSRIRGYATEVHTHLNLASAVKSGNADVGLGILEAAKAHGLDFIPLIPERLDFVIPKVFLKNYPVRCLLKTLNSEDFKEEVGVLGGYDVRYTGKVIYEQEGKKKEKR